MIRSYGIKGIKKYLKKHIKLAQYLALKIDINKNFELTSIQNMNMINFRFISSENNDRKYLNNINNKLIKKLNETGKIYLTHTKIQNIISIRMPIGSTYVKKKHIKKSWDLIKKTASTII